MRLAPCGACNIWVRCNPAGAVGINTALVKAPRVGVNPGPNAGLFVHILHESVNPINALVALPVQDGDTLAEIVAAIVNEKRGFADCVAVSCKVIKPPGISAEIACG